MEATIDPREYAHQGTGLALLKETVVIKPGDPCPLPTCDGIIQAVEGEQALSCDNPACDLYVPADPDQQAFMIVDNQPHLGEFTPCHGVTKGLPTDAMQTDHWTEKPWTQIDIALFEALMTTLISYQVHFFAWRGRIVTIGQTSDEKYWVIPVNADLAQDVLMGLCNRSNRGRRRARL